MAARFEGGAERGAAVAVVVDDQQGERTLLGNGVGGLFSGRAASMAGMRSVKVDPSPGTDRTVREPPISSEMRLEMGRPRPVPVARSLVVKKGSKMRARVASSMPRPVSVTRSATQAVPPLSAARGRRRVSTMRRGSGAQLAGERMP